MAEQLIDEINSSSDDLSNSSNSSVDSFVVIDETVPEHVMNIVSPCKRSREDFDSRIARAEVEHTKLSQELHEERIKRRKLETLVESMKDTLEEVVKKTKPIATIQKRASKNTRRISELESLAINIHPSPRSAQPKPNTHTKNKEMLIETNTPKPLFPKPKNISKQLYKVGNLTPFSSSQLSNLNQLKCDNTIVMETHERQGIVIATPSTGKYKYTELKFFLFDFVMYSLDGQEPSLYQIVKLDTELRSTITLYLNRIEYFDQSMANEYDITLKNNHSSYLRTTETFEVSLREFMSNSPVLWIQDRHNTTSLCHFYVISRFAGIPVEKNDSCSPYIRASFKIGRDLNFLTCYQKQNRLLSLLHIET